MDLERKATPERIASIIRMIEAYRDRKVARRREKTRTRVQRHRAEKNVKPPAQVVRSAPSLKELLPALDEGCR